jgi:hypothetical protein
MGKFWFKSPLFVVEPGEDLETNPGIFGRQLARWLAAKLQAAGHAQVEVRAEDWGWCLLCEREPVRVWVGCASAEGSSASGEAMVDARTWHCFVEVEPTVVQRLMRRGAAAAAERIGRELESILKGEPAITLVGEP